MRVGGPGSKSAPVQPKARPTQNEHRTDNYYKIINNRAILRYEILVLEIFDLTDEYTEKKVFRVLRSENINALFVPM
ncbi:hypothetical protein V1478_005284 [Vespula squamosa]|uniref:Uncharacterized protein n=1 Tax=Vespula squamosa TaxID=30214 RepID=A0ABD2BDR1_VESSQ